VSERCPNATVCLDSFHIVKAATDALDKVRREVCNEARRQGRECRRIRVSVIERIGHAYISAL
jgi:transposase